MNHSNAIRNIVAIERHSINVYIANQYKQRNFRIQLLKGMGLYQQKLQMLVVIPIGAEIKQILKMSISTTCQANRKINSLMIKLNAEVVVVVVDDDDDDDDDDSQSLLSQDKIMDFLRVAQL